MSERKYSNALAWTAANEVGTLITSACHRVEVAGSLRRGSAFVHDVDMVIHAKYEVLHVPDLFGNETVWHIPVVLLAALNGIVKFGGDAKIVHFTHRGMPVELYLAEPDGSNFGALLQMRTGPAEHNRNLAARAQSIGLSYRAGHGIYMGERRVDDGSEDGVYRALGLACPAPEQRR